MFSCFKTLNVSRRVWKVWLRNKDVFMKTVKVSFLPPFLEPILYLLGLGFGLGVFVGELDGIPYPVYIAPALICVSMMNSSFFECTYATFVRMHYQKTFDAIISTPLNIDEVILGEILWGSTKSVVNASIMLSAVSMLRIVSLPASILIVPLAFLVGLVFSAIAMCFTSIAPNIDFFNYPTYLFITPMFIFSGTFFPLSALPKPIQTISFALFPLTHAVHVARQITTGLIDPKSLLSLIWLATVGTTLTIISIIMMKRRLIV